MSSAHLEKQVSFSKVHPGHLVLDCMIPKTPDIRQLARWRIFPFSSGPMHTTSSMGGMRPITEELLFQACLAFHTACISKNALSF
jgi:hypothetical protein